MSAARKPCPRCGRVDCDQVDPAIWPKLVRLFELLPRDETPEPDDGPPPFI